VEVEQLAESFESMRQGIREREAEVHQLAFWDPLTGLPNRAQFFKQLQERLRASREPLALLMLNLDRFKPVNDALGRELGDELLRMVALRLKPFVTETIPLLRAHRDMAAGLSAE
jgi:GGDEF domain-containing protein